MARNARLELHADLIGTLLGSVSSRFEFAETPAETPETVTGYRRNEYGPGLGARAEAILLVGEHPVVQATYRYQWIHTTNDTPLNGGGADHDLQIASLRLRAPLGRRFGVGIDGDLFLREQPLRQPAARRERRPRAAGARVRDVEARGLLGRAPGKPGRF